MSVCPKKANTLTTAAWPPLKEEVTQRRKPTSSLLTLMLNQIKEIFYYLINLLLLPAYVSSAHDHYLPLIDDTGWRRLIGDNAVLSGGAAPNRLVGPTLLEGLQSETETVRVDENVVSSPCWWNHSSKASSTKRKQQQLKPRCYTNKQTATYLSQAHRPQHLPRSVRFFSASFISELIWSKPSSIRSNCSERRRRSTTKQKCPRKAARLKTQQPGTQCEAKEIITSVVTIRLPAQGPVPFCAHTQVLVELEPTCRKNLIVKC